MLETIPDSTLVLLAVIGAVHLIALVSPGPDFALVVRSSLVYSKRTALWMTTGIALGIVVHATYGMLGLTWLTEVLPNLLIYIKYLAVGYLSYLGIGAIKNGLQLRAEYTRENLSTVNSPNNTFTMSALQAVRIGFVTNLLNPKAIIFFVSFFTVIFDQEFSTTIKVIIAAQLTLLTFAWFASLALLLSTSKIQVFFARSKHIIEIITGIVLIIFAIMMLFVTL